MGNTYWEAPTSNFWSTSLNGAINDSVTTITLNSTSGLQAPGYLVIDRENSSGTATPSSREIISFTGISGSDITGVTRGADNSTARSHSDSALVEATPTIGMWSSREKLDNDSFMTGRNNADSGFVNMFKVNISDRLEAGAQFEADGANILDEDDMASDDANALATQQSLKAYHDGGFYSAWVAKGVKDNGNTGSTQAIDWSNGDRQKCTLTDNCTFSFSNAAEGQVITLIMVQDGTGSRTHTWPGTMKWPSGSEPSWGTSANDINIVTIYYDGSNYYGQGAVAFA